MLPVRWREEYVIDEGTIDDERKSLFQMANRIIAVEHPESRREEIWRRLRTEFG